MGHQNHLYVWEDRFLYLTPAIASGLTPRHTTTLLVALGEEGFELGDESGQRQRYQAALVGQNVARTLDATRAPLLSLNFDPQSYEHHALSALMGGHPVRAVILKPARRDRDSLAEAARGSLDFARLFRLTTDLPMAISGYHPVRVPMDMRVIHVAQKIKRELPLTSTVAELAAQVGLCVRRWAR